ncbi:uncharacterized protein LOC109363970 isoform X2 [Meleagris gallopavo]|uniref:uncharacterized protein LOC109363970 isoform X2 n=1 Tax=Meleagris gallopavo TaxID=9103 RepID=UPI00093A0690|nr:uncharacterized protein LOC109363970 isoform X2 [Meleagris gallopavo]
MSGSGPSMLNAIKLALHDWQCFGPCLLTFLMAWAALCCLLNFSKKGHQVRSWHRTWCMSTQESVGEVHTDLGELGLLSLDGRPLGQFLCYRRDCEHCSQAIWKRLLWHHARWARMRAFHHLHSSSSSNSSTSCRDANTASSSHSSTRRNLATQINLPSVELLCQSELRKLRKFHLEHTVIYQKLMAMQGPADTITFNLGLLSQAHQLIETEPVQPMRDACHWTGSLPTVVSTADKDVNLPTGVDSHHVSRLEQGLDFWKLLNILRKSEETKLSAFPTIVQKSHKMHTHRIAVSTANTPHHSSTVPIYFCSREGLFLKEEVQEALELHIRAKKLHHQWGLPGRLLATPQA